MNRLVVIVPNKWREKGGNDNHNNGKRIPVLNMLKCMRGYKKKDA